MRGPGTRLHLLVAAIATVTGSVGDSLAEGSMGGPVLTGEGCHGAQSFWEILEAASAGP